jgi:hypothetical protein
VGSAQEVYMKLVINAEFGGFSVSQTLLDLYNARTAKSVSGYCAFRDESERSDPELVKLVEQLGPKASHGGGGKLVVQEIPDGVSWSITDYDGSEGISLDYSKNRTDFVDKLLKKYFEAQHTAIWETSTSIADSEANLNLELVNLKAEWNNINH